MKALGTILGVWALFTSGGLAQVPTCVSLPPGLISWWRGENDALDAVGPNNGIWFGAGFTAGKAGTGFNFTGSGDDYVVLPVNVFPVPIIGEGTTPFSFDAWFKTSVGGVILGQQDVAPFGNPLGGYVPALYVGTNGLMYAQCFWGNGTQIISTNKVNDGLFHHVAVTYDGANQVLYIDGTVAGSGPLLQRAYAPFYVYQLGTGFTGGWQACPGGWFPFTGVIDEVSLWGRALAPSEVVALYNADTAGKCVPMARPLLLHRYSFNEASGTRRVVDSATALDGALLFATPAAPYTNGAPDTSGFTGTGSLHLSGTNGFVAFPSLLVWPLSTVTLELWLEWDGSQSGSAQRIFQFGSTLPGAAPAPGPAFLALSTSLPGSNVLAFEDSGFMGGSPATETNAFVLTTPAISTGSTTYIAVTYDPVDGLSQLFVNGSKTAEVRTNLLQSLSQFAGAGNWLGRSESTTDGFLHGQLDEFRVWEGVLPDWRIAEHFAAGPDQSLPVFPPKLVTMRSPSTLQVRWRADVSTGFGLESSPALSSAQWKSVDAIPALADAWNQVAVPATNNAFFRLKK